MKMNFKSMSDITKMLRKGEVVAQELYEHSLSQIKATAHLNAFIDRRSEASSCKEEYNCDKPLSGIPFAVKDNFCTKDFRTTCASRMLDNYTPPFNATVVQRLLDAGAVLMGKTNMDEYAMGSGSVDSYYGPVRNPWSMGTDTEGVWHVAGGSSGGSAVAVAAGVCSFALGSDTGGSVRNPAAYCGVVGLKPTYGLLSRYGLIPLVNSMDVPGVITRTVEDAETIFNILSGHDPLDSTTYVSSSIRMQPKVSCDQLTVGVPKEFNVDGLSEEVKVLWDECVTFLQELGAKVKQVSLPHAHLSVPCYSVLCSAEVMSNKARYDGLRFGHRDASMKSANEMFALTRKQAFCDTVRSRVLLGSYFLLRENKEKYYNQALRVRRLINNDFNEVFGHLNENPTDVCDILITPVVLGDAPLYNDFIKHDNRTRCAEQDIFTQPSNLAGIPSVSVPVGISQNGLPLALQIIGPKFSDVKILEIAKIIEKKINFPSLMDYFESSNHIHKNSESIKL